MDNLVIKIINCYKEYINKLVVGLDPDYGELNNAILFVESAVTNQTLWDFYYNSLEYDDYYTDFVVQSTETPVIITVPVTLKFEKDTPANNLEGHLPIIENESGELYVKMPLLEDL